MRKWFVQTAAWTRMGGPMLFRQADSKGGLLRVRGRDVAPWGRSERRIERRWVLAVMAAAVAAAVVAPRRITGSAGRPG